MPSERKSELHLHSTGPRESKSGPLQDTPVGTRGAQPQEAWGGWKHPEGSSSFLRLSLQNIFHFLVPLLTWGLSSPHKALLGPTAPSLMGPLPPPLRGPCLARTPSSSQSPPWPQVHPPLPLSSQGLRWGQWLQKRHCDQRRGNRITMSDGRGTAGPGPRQQLNAMPGTQQHPSEVWKQPDLCTLEDHHFHSEQVTAVWAR